MRNLSQYPVTAEEKLRAVRWAVEQAQASVMQRGVGDTTLAALRALQRELENDAAAATV